MINSIRRSSFVRRGHAVLVVFIVVVGWIAIQFLVELSRPPSVYLVLATMKSDQYTWASKLSILNLYLIPYVADDQNAKFHPPANKGNEAMMYLTYLYDFYDHLPDISIFTHASENGWHNDAIFNKKVSKTIEHLDLDDVRRRKYVNLRTGHMEGCSTRINTSMSLGSPGYNPKRPEEAYVKAAFEENFAGQTVPEMLGAPCCSQFAVTKEAIRRNPRSQYKEHVEWILKQTLDNHISGRIWESLWQYLFLGKPVECPNEYKTLCSQYHICFPSSADFDSWSFLERTRMGDMADEETDEATQIALGAMGGHLRVMLDHVKAEAKKRGKSKLSRDEIARNPRLPP